MNDSIAVRRPSWQLVLTHAVLILVSLAVIFPLVWMISVAFKPKMEIFSFPYALLPKAPSFDNFTSAWSYAPFAEYYLNTVVIVFGLLAIQLITVSMAAFAFARLGFPGRNILFLMFLTQLMITAQSTIYPNYMTVSRLGLLDTRIGVMLPYMASAMGVFLMRQAFMVIPMSLEDAARIDGCSVLQTIANVFIPQVKPSLVAFSIMSVTSHWNEFLWPLLVTESTDSRPLTVGLTVFAQQAEGGAEWGLLMAATLIVSLPLLLAFMFFQKMFVDSFISSGLKG